MRTFKCCLVITHRKPIVEPGENTARTNSVGNEMGDSIRDLHFQEHLTAGGGLRSWRVPPSTHRCAQELAPVGAQVEEHPSPGTGQGGPADQQDEEDEVGQRGRHPHHLQQRWPSSLQHPHRLHRALPQRPCPEFRQPGELHHRAATGHRVALALRGPLTLPEVFTPFHRLK